MVEPPATSLTSSSTLTFPLAYWPPTFSKKGKAHLGVFALAVLCVCNLLPPKHTSSLPSGFGWSHGFPAYPSGHSFSIPRSPFLTPNPDIYPLCMWSWPISPDWNIHSMTVRVLFYSHRPSKSTHWLNTECWYNNYSLHEIPCLSTDSKRTGKLKSLDLWTFSSAVHIAQKFIQ